MGVFVGVTLGVGVGVGVTNTGAIKNSTFGLPRPETKSYPNEAL